MIITAKDKEVVSSLNNFKRIYLKKVKELCDILNMITISTMSKPSREFRKLEKNLLKLWSLIEEFNITYEYDFNALRGIRENERISLNWKGKSYSFNDSNFDYSKLEFVGYVHEFASLISKEVDEILEENIYTISLIHLIKDELNSIVTR